jgi:hypothetical protein
MKPGNFTVIMLTKWGSTHGFVAQRTNTRKGAKKVANRHVILCFHAPGIVYATTSGSNLGSDAAEQGLAIDE